MRISDWSSDVCSSDLYNGVLHSPWSRSMLRILAEALTFDDVSLVPAHSIVLPKDVRLGSRLTRGLNLNLPILSSAMDTVTEGRLAIAMAQLGGIGIRSEERRGGERGAGRWSTR